VKDGQAEREHAPAAELVAQPSGGDEEGGEGQAVAGDHPFDRAGAGVQVGLHRGMATLTMKKSRTTMKVPVRTTAEGRPWVRRGAGRPTAWEVRVGSCS
jgi:hypothetical protein